MYKAVKVNDFAQTNLETLIGLAVTNTEKKATIIKRQFIMPCDIFQVVVSKSTLQSGNMLMSFFWGNTPDDNVIYTQRHVVVHGDQTSYVVMRLTPQGQRSLIRVDKLNNGEYITYVYTDGNTAHHRSEMKRFGATSDNIEYELGDKYKPLTTALKKELSKTMRDDVVKNAKLNEAGEIVIDARLMYNEKNPTGRRVMRCDIQLKTMSTTKLEGLLSDVVVHHTTNPSFTRGVMVSTDVIKDVVTAEELHVTIGALLMLPWTRLTNRSILQMQYIALEDLGGDDVEIILRVDPRGNRTVISIETSKEDDDYEDAIVHIYYEGSEIRLREELFEFEITMDNFETVVGDLLVDHSDTKENTFGNSKVFMLTDATTGERIQVTKE